MGNFVSNVGGSIIDGIKDLFTRKADKNDNKLFPQIEISKPFQFKYDGSEIFWCEWWTLYFYDYDGQSENRKIFGMINYIFIKSLNEIGRCIVYPAVCCDNISHNAWDIYKLEDFVVSDNEVSIGKNKIIKNGEDIYTFSGASTDGKIKWNITINRKKHDPISVAQKIKMGLDTKINIPVLENISFASIIPLGYISGSVDIDDASYGLTQYGEMEHLWGPAVLPLLNWNMMFGSDINNNLIFWLHSPTVSNVEEKGCVYLNLNGKEYLLRDYDMSEIINDNEYPNEINIKSTLENIEIKYEIISISASNKGSASENHVKVTVIHDKNNIYTLYGIAEYYRKKIRALEIME